MSWIQAVILGIIQGITEFLPVSSSAHLILPAQVLGWAEQGLAFDVAVHVGTLLAVLLFYRQRIFRMLAANVDAVQGKGFSAEAKLMWLIGLGTIPAGLAGILFNDYIETNFRSVLVIASTTLIFGVLLGLAERFSNRSFANNVHANSQSTQPVGIKAIMLIGLAQALALIPGTSRSGVTMTAALFLGFDKKTAADVSFLLSIPIIVAAGGLKAIDLYQGSVSGELSVDWLVIGIGVATSFVCAYACIALFLNVLNRVGFKPFVIYRLILAAVLFGFVLMTAG